MVEIVSSDTSLVEAEGIRADDVIVSVMVARDFKRLTISPDIPADVKQYVKTSIAGYDEEPGRKDFNIAQFKAFMKNKVAKSVVHMVVSKKKVNALRQAISQYANVEELAGARENEVKQWFKTYDSDKGSAELCRTEQGV